MTILVILAITGLIISIYGITIERKLEQDSQYKATCDISDTISCSRPMLSQYNKIFGISNSLAAALYYIAVLIAVIINMPLLLMLVVTTGLVITLVFAYILYFKIKSVCLICTSLYLINITLAILCYFF